ncbi:hypothetical protein P691DRAFT_723639 [Macrolepiota fuliginosa MF-IS2]|uniref:WW domain-containing protein n=1 Tax=Macrolepiota fuliginosa MF-IS2 TaxID=1400762 RepID=A0A9P5XL06_9AGAR|nr:hypothetical protein P691DRAFT_723639 [Macrolepiota fuliginosa MF-IS2]
MHSLSDKSVPLSRADSDPFLQNEFNPCKSTDTGALMPEGWKICVHPQGWMYFFNPTLKIASDHDVRNPEIYASIMNDADRGYTLDDSMEIHFFAQGHQTTAAGRIPKNFYLFVDHSRCIAFYEDELELMYCKDIEFDIRMNRRARLYWNYVWNHPVHIPTPKRATTEALDALTWFYTDNLISSHKSTVPFSKLECEDLLRIVHQLSGRSAFFHGECRSRLLSEDSTYGHAPARTVFLAWILRESYKYRDAENHGQYTAKDFMTYQRSKLPQADPVPTLSLPMLLFQFLLIRCLFFGIPNTYYLHVKLTSEYRGRLASVQSNWESYVDRLVREYSHFLLISTVLLSYESPVLIPPIPDLSTYSATIGFLSAPNLPEVTVVLAVASALISLGAIIIGVFSIWTHQAKTQKANLYTYLYNAKHSHFGFLGHAIILSLPPVLLIWAILAFTVALLTYAVQGINDAGLVTQLSAWSILVVFAVIFVIIIVALYTFSTVWKFRQRTDSLLGRVKNAWVGCMYV